MADLALLTVSTPASAAVSQVLPGLALLPHVVTVLPMDPGKLLTGADPDLVVVDAVTDLVAGHGALRTLAAMGLESPVLTVVDDAGLGLLDEGWPTDDIIVATARPGELAARVRRLLSRPAPRRTPAPVEAVAPTRRAEGSHDVLVDEASWTVRVAGNPLDLTFKEFELLRYLVQHPGRVVTRDLLLQEVWGLDYYGGTRTVDVHIRRLRAKLGPERESLIGTIRGVGYRFDGSRGESA